MDDDFTPLEKAAWGGLMGNYGRMMRWIDADLREHFRITHAEFEVLLRLSWADGYRMRIQDLTAKSQLTQSGISRVVERLQRVDLVRREGASEDKRGAYAVLTDTGLVRLKEALRHHVAFVREHFLGFLSEKELKQMAALWQRIEEGQVKSVRS